MKAWQDSNCHVSIRDDGKALQYVWNVELLELFCAELGDRGKPIFYYKVSM